MPAETRKLTTINEVKYVCDHVIATLLDDILFEYHQTVNWTTRQNIEYLLDKQTTKHWRLGTCDFTRYFHYKWEDENGLLGPLFSIAQPFDEQYVWTYDTQSYPWTVNLVRPETQVSCEIRYGKNQREIERDIDPANIVNRIYPKGYGEGVNQLTIRKVNANKPYLEDSASIAKYGLKAYVWVDRRFEDVNSLKASAQALLTEWSVPKVSYRVKAVDLSSLTGMDVDKLRLGRVVRIIDPDLGKFEARIVNESKADITGDPGEIELEIANKTADLGTTAADIERRQQINEVYAQGATNLGTYNFDGNCDATNPAIIKFYLPDEMVRINKLLLTYETTNFEAYSKAAKSTTTKTTTTKSGGGQTTSAGGGQTTSAGGGQTTSSGGGTVTTTAGGGDHTHKMFSATGFQTASNPNSSVILRAGNGQYIYVDSDTAAGIEYHTEGSSGTHTHQLTLNSHTHSVNDHTHSVNDHTHSVNDHTHEIVIEGHGHPLEYGIYKHTSLPNQVTIKVDGISIPGNSLSSENVDLIPYLSKDSEGKVVRGWHKIELFPNDLAMINANVFAQFFLQSRGGGNY